MAPAEMRRHRVKEFVEKYAQVKVSDPASVKAAPSRDQEDDGRFVSKYFDTVANKQYQQLFC